MANLNEYPAFEAHIRKIIPVNDNDLQRICSYFCQKKIRKKEYLLTPAQSCKHESYIVRGLFQSSIVDDSGKNHVLYFPHEDWWVSDFKSFKTGERSSMEVLALEDAELLQISKPALDDLYCAVTIFERFFRILNENAGIALQDRLSQHYTNDALKKYIDFQSTYPKLQNRLSHKSIAGFLGVTPEYFSQMLKNAHRPKT